MVFGWLVFLLAVIMVGRALGQDRQSAPDSRWQTVLDLQLRSERGCTLAHIVSERAFSLAGADALEGRIRCTDGREFDFSRAKPHLKFTLRLCQPAVC